MSVFNDNITNDISDTEKVRIWITNEVIEYFNYLHSHINSDKYWKSVDMNNTHDMTRAIHMCLARRWVESIHEGYLRNMGVAYTRTDVKKKIGKNQFVVNIGFLFDPTTAYEDVEIKNLEI